MTPASASLLLIGAILVASGILNRSIVDTALGESTEMDTGRQTFGGQADVGAVPAGMDDHRGFGSGGVALFDGKPVARWIRPVLVWARANGWKGRVTSGVRSIAQQRAACASTTGPCATPGTSNHQKTQYPGGAVDVTDWQTLATLVPMYPGPGPTLVHAVFANDPVHFSGNGH